jgi:hypothetical protein
LQKPSILRVCDRDERERETRGRLMISGFYWYTADGQFLDAHQDKKGALAISPPIVLLAGKHGISHNSLILPPDVAVVWIVPEEPRVANVLCRVK